jgi:GTP-binding protein Era
VTPGEDDSHTERRAGAAPDDRQATTTRAGFVALVGAPNAGKSTLINALVGAKVSIVSRKVQTTRTQIRGIAMKDQAQIIFVDTPGIFQPKRGLDRAMVASAWGGAGDADVVLVLVDVAKARDPETTELLDRVNRLSKTVALVLNKIDRLPREALIGISQSLNENRSFAATFMIAALTGDGCAAILDWLPSRLPQSPWYYPEDQISDAPLRFLAAEITREICFDRLHEELPYSLTVETDTWETAKDGSAKINQTIFVQREGHKKIVIGEKGSTIKAIGSAARRAIATVNEAPVHLFLFVKVRENWLDDPERYRAMGLDFPAPER